MYVYCDLLLISKEKLFGLHFFELVMPLGCTDDKTDYDRPWKGLRSFHLNIDRDTFLRGSQILIKKIRSTPYAM